MSAPASEEVTVRCPFCRTTDSRVVDSRDADEGQAIRRRRACTACGRRFTTVETTVLAVVKRSGVTEPFSRDKVLTGVRKACQGRPVTDDDLAVLAQRVEEAVRARGQAEIAAHDVGLAVLTPLRDLDAVAYLRFASVYRSFTSIDDFAAEIELLRATAADAPSSTSSSAASGEGSTCRTGPARVSSAPGGSPVAAASQSSTPPRNASADPGVVPDNERQDPDD